ncbi:hypothetical protein RND81_09G021400 [Saponaria officinalis]|uniref:GAG-pre-integrase domain-containing protein n=1 Tax=Saponaria officinalis TaxID=3572 RepID=A0AAW1IGQ8_SAPOF
MVLRWLLNSLARDIRANVIYAKSSKELWTELVKRYGQLKALKLYQLKKDVIYTCHLMKLLLERETHSKVIQLLMGLNSGYDSVKTHILSMDILCPMNKALGFSSKRSSSSNWKKLMLDKEDKEARECTHCLRKVNNIEECFKLKTCAFCNTRCHIKEYCYKLKALNVKAGRSSHGYRRNANNADVLAYNPKQITENNIPLDYYSNSQYFSAHMSSSSQTDLSNVMNSEVVQEIVNNVMSQVLQGFHDKTPSTEDKSSHSIHLAGICCYLSFSVFSGSSMSYTADWIIDSRASNHMAFYYSFLTDIHALNTPILGVVAISPHITLLNVIYNPDFKQNLLSVGRLIDKSNMTLVFLQNDCLFPDRSSNEVLARAYGIGGLYKLRSHSTSSRFQSIPVIPRQTISNNTLFSASSSTSTDVGLIHFKHGHSSSEKLKHALPSLHINKDFFCDSCLRAKHHSLSFPRSSSYASNCFELLYMDVWGPYKTVSLSGARSFFYYPRRSL